MFDPLSLSAFHSQTEHISISTFYTSLHARAAATTSLFISLTPLDIVQQSLHTLSKIDPYKKLPLHGVPYVLKDNIDAPPHPTTAACPAFAYTPSIPAFVVDLLQNAGAILLGKVNMDQFACGLVGTRSPYGTPENPHQAQFIPGGSSSGSAVATAMGLCVFALGSDTAGSGRVPAAMNQLVGFKPTRGIVSTTGVVPAIKRLDCISIFATCVEDAAAILRIVAKEDKGNVFSRVSAGTLSEVDAFSGQFHFGVPAGQYLTFDGDEVSKNSFWNAVEILEAIGGHKVEIDFGVFKEAAGLLYGGALVAERFSEVGEFLKNGIEEGVEGFDETVSGIILKGEKIPAWKLQKDLLRILELTRDAEHVAWNSVDMLIVPSVPRPVTVEEVREEPIKVNSMLGTYTNYVNLMDYCAVAIPAPQVDGEEVPRGITIVAKAFKDNLLLQVASAFEHRSEMNN